MSREEDHAVMNCDSEPRGRGRVPPRATKVVSRDSMEWAMYWEEDHAAVDRDSEPRGRGRVPPLAVKVVSHDIERVT